MDGLRWLLLLFGVLVVVGVYFYSRRESERAGEDVPPERRVTPTLDTPAETDDVDEADPEDAEPEPEFVETPQKIVTLRIVARDRDSFKGDDLVLSLRGIGMRHGKFGIFHRYDGSNDEKTVFSAASLVEPGSFDLANIAEQAIPGISLFLVLPGPIDAAEAFDMMMESARALAQGLNGDLLDESGSNLSIQRERYMREEVIQFQHSILVA